MFGVERGDCSVILLLIEQHGGKTQAGNARDFQLFAIGNDPFELRFCCGQIGGVKRYFCRQQCAARSVAGAREFFEQLCGGVFGLRCFVFGGCVRQRKVQAGGLCRLFGGVILPALVCRDGERDHGDARGDVIAIARPPRFKVAQFFLFV